MPPDLREALEQAAAKPTRSPDFESILRRGHRERRQRAALAVLSIVAAVAVPLGVAAGGASIGSLFERNGTDPVAPTEKTRRDCPDTPFDLTAYFVRSSDRTDMRRATRALQRMPGVAEVERVGRYEAFAELKKIYSKGDLPVRAYPGWVYVVTAGDKGIDELARRIDRLTAVAEVVVIDAQQQRIRCRLRRQGAELLGGI